jgi:hypothetical protein
MYTLASQQSSRCGKIQMQDVTIEMYILNYVAFVKEITEYRRQQLQPEGRMRMLQQLPLQLPPRENGM